jgi:hypothetical protein
MLVFLSHIERLARLKEKTETKTIFKGSDYLKNLKFGRKINIKLCTLLLTLVLIVPSCNLNRKLVGTIHYKRSDASCTKVGCFCCNDCSSPLLFITDSDTFHLYGTVKDTGFTCSNDEFNKKKCDTTITVRTNAPLECKGKDCNNFYCGTFEYGKKYEIVGYLSNKSIGNYHSSFTVRHFVKSEQ